MRRGVVSLLVLVCLWGAEARARCGPLLLKIKGEAHANSSKKIVVRIAPDPHGSNPLVLLEGNRFEADVYFDPSKVRASLFGSSCSERPKTVTVALLENGRETDRQELVFKRDFVSDGDGSFVLRKSLKLGK